ncbi:uncharacterized protein [Amphiura filiformis]|uniref:uncharacterized protein n=1 Tax=Amphiura filiformis TaxID=82378 RepID=UPI003B2192B7
MTCDVQFFLSKNFNPGWAVCEIENSTAVRVIYGIVALVGLVENFLVCFTLIRFPALRSRTSHFIIHLAISDIITLTWVIPFHLFPFVPVFPQQPGYDALCRLFFSKFPLWSTIFASAYSLLLVTMERFTAIVFPIKHKVIFTNRNSGFMMAACWFIGIISNVFMLYAHYKMITELHRRLKEIDAKRAGKAIEAKAVKKETWQLRGQQPTIPEVPPPIEHGWISQPGEFIEPVWTERAVLPTRLEELLIDITEEEGEYVDAEEDDTVYMESDFSDMEDSVNDCLLLVTTERFTAIVFPIKHKVIFTNRNSGFMMAACWYIGIISNLNMFRIFALREGVCSVEWPPHNPSFQIGVGIYNMTIVYVFPISFMLYAHYKMITELKHRLKEIDAKRSGKVRESKSVRKEAWQLRVSEQLIRTLLWVVITYAVCWAPNQFLFFAYNMGANVDFTQPYYHFSVIFAIFNSCMNPIIYSLKNKPYRVGLKEALKWGKLSQAARSASRLAGISKTDSSGGAPKALNTPLSSVVTGTSARSPPTSVVDEASNI